MLIVIILLLFNTCKGGGSETEEVQTLNEKITELNTQKDTLEKEKKELKKQLAVKNNSLKNYIIALNKANSDLKQWNDWYEHNKHLLTEQEHKSNVIEFDLSEEFKQQENTNQVLYQYLQEANNQPKY